MGDIAMIALNELLVQRKHCLASYYGCNPHHFSFSLTFISSHAHTHGQTPASFIIGI